MTFIGQRYEPLEIITDPVYQIMVLIAKILKLMAKILNCLIGVLTVL